MISGEALVAEIDATRTSTGEMAFWWLGQHSFVVKMGEAVLYLDPFLTAMKARRVEPLVKAEEVRHATLVLGSHDHIDHIDRKVWPGLAKASPGAKFVVPELLLPKLAEDLGIGAERFVGLDDGRVAEVAGVKITGIAAAHEFLDRDPVSGKYPYLGFVVEGNGCRIYHSGDCCKYEGLETRLKNVGKLDVMFLPINGRDAKRFAGGCIGNMTFQEAVDLAGAVGPGLAVPAHYEMFAGNSANPADFVEYMRVKYPGVGTCVCGHGERVVVKGRHEGT